MKNRIIAVVIAMALVLTVGWIMPGQAQAGWDVHISVPLYGLYYAPAPYGYAVPAPAPVPAPAGAVFYGGYWYLPSEGNWYIAAQTGGPWSVIAMERVPYAVISGPVLMPHAQPYYSYPYRPSVGIAVNPWINIGGHSGGHGHGHGRGHDD